MNLINELECEKAHSDHMTAIAEVWMRRAQAAEQTIAILTHAAGGQIKVYPHHLHDAPNLVLERMEFPHDMSTRFRARFSGGTPEGEG